MYLRSLANVLESNRRSALVLGPRQVGKSTLLASTAPDISLNLASPRVFRDFVAHPERLERELLAAQPGVRTVFLDEVQRVPALLDVVQLFLDEHPGRFRFLLSGSSARKLRRGQANLLPGRIHVHQMHPLLACELGGDFSLDRALAHGTLPGIYAEQDGVLRAADLRSYADTYLREEIQAEALVRNLGGFSRLLDLMAASSGRILNVQAMCRQAGLGYETARRYIEVLEDTLVMFRIPAWRGSSRSSVVAHARLFLFDIGVRNALLRRPLDAPLPDERGILLEHFVACELHRRLRTLWPEAALFHYRTRSGAEVDFVLEVGRDLWGIEVKASRRVTRSMLRGLASLAARSDRVRRRIVIFLGERRQLLDGVEVLPLAEFLEELPGRPGQGPGPRTRCLTRVGADLDSTAGTGPTRGDVRIMDVQVNWSRDAGVLVAVLSGRVDSGNSAAFHEALKEGIPEGERTLALDCGQLTYMSSAGLRVLLDMSRRFRGPRKAMGLCGLPESIDSVVRLSGFDKIIPVHESIADAVAAISGKVGPGDDAAPKEEVEEADGAEESSGKFRFRLGKRSTTM